MPVVENKVRVDAARSVAINAKSLYVEDGKLEMVRLNKPWSDIICDMAETIEYLNDEIKRLKLNQS